MAWGVRRTAGPRPPSAAIRHLLTRVPPRDPVQLVGRQRPALGGPGRGSAPSRSTGQSRRRSRMRQHPLRAGCPPRRATRSSRRRGRSYRPDPAAPQRSSGPRSRRDPPFDRPGEGIVGSLGHPGACAVPGPVLIGIPPDEGGAGAEIRTRIPFREADFKSAASACSATPARRSVPAPRLPATRS